MVSDYGVSMARFLSGLFLFVTVTEGRLLEWIWPTWVIVGSLLSEGDFSEQTLGFCAGVREGAAESGVLRTSHACWWAREGKC